MKLASHTTQSHGRSIISGVNIRALVSHAKVAEAAVAPMPHEIKGQGLYAFVTLKDGIQESVV